MSTVRTASFMAGRVDCGQNSPRYVTNRLAFAAQEVSRTNHTNHATCMPMNRPNAAWAYK